MTCEQVRAELVECWGRTEKLCAAAFEHIEICVECRREAVLLRETYVMVTSLPTERAPDGFTSRIMDQISREDARPSWSERLAEVFVPKGRPSWARAAAVGTAIALAVAGGAVWLNQEPEPTPGAQIAAQPAVTATVDSVTDPAVGESELDELMIRHQTMEMSQPLADDAGVSLVVYTSN